MPADRVRTQLERLAGTGLDTPTFATAAIEVLRGALPFTAACLATTDPATELVTSTVKWGGLTDAQDEDWGYHEYEVVDIYDSHDVIRRPGGVASIHLETGGQPQRLRRFAEFFEPRYGFEDELRAAFTVDGATWGFFALFRDGRGSAFAPAELELVSSISHLFGIGLRTGLLVSSVHAAEAIDGPAVLVVDAEGDVVQAGVGAEARVAELGGGPRSRTT